MEIKCDSVEIEIIFKWDCPHCKTERKDITHIDELLTIDDLDHFEAYPVCVECGNDATVVLWSKCMSACN